MGTELASTARMPDSRLGWPLTIMTAIALLFLAFAFWAVWINATESTFPDFLIFWAAGKVTLAGNPGSAYDIAALHAAEQAIAPDKWLPLAYPPPILFFLAAVALLPFAAAFGAWLFATGALYLFGATRFTRWQYALSNPPLLVNLMVGQTGFLMSGLFLTGLSLVSSSPVVAGMILGALVLKPQLALLLPFAMIAGREWRVIAGATVSSALLVAAGLAAFGPGAYAGFFGALPQYVAKLQSSSWPWNELASPFALARFAGIPQGSALVLHASIATAAVLVTVRAWWLKLDERIPVLAAATLLVPPYLFTYDALLLITPAAWLIRERRFAVVAVMWLLLLVPLLSYFTPWAWPNLVPVAAAACIWSSSGCKSRFAVSPVSSLRRYQYVPHPPGKRRT